MADKIRHIQLIPVPVWEVDDDTIPYDVIEFVQSDLPEDMSIVWRGRVFHFRTKEERIQFSFGIDVALDGPEEKP